MKLFKIATHIEGENYIDNVLLSVGKSFYFNNEPNGWYIRLELPFTKTVDYVDAQDFLNKTGPCRKIYLWFKRPGIKRVLKANVWKPMLNT